MKNLFWILLIATALAVSGKAFGDPTCPKKALCATDPGKASYLVNTVCQKRFEQLQIQSRLRLDQSPEAGTSMLHRKLNSFDKQNLEDTLKRLDTQVDEGNEYFKKWFAQEFNPSMCPAQFYQLKRMLQNQKGAQ